MQLSEHDEGAHPGALPAVLPEGSSCYGKAGLRREGLAAKISMSSASLCIFWRC